MCYKCYVLVPLSDAKTSLEARQYVHKDLGSDTSFVSESGRFAEPMCNQFSVGGTWSGRLYPTTLLENFCNQASQLQQRDDGIGLSDLFIQEHRKQLDTIWQEMGGKYESPLTRDQYRELGEEDDACILEDWLVKKLNSYLISSDKYYVNDVSIIDENWGTPKVISLDSDLFNDLKNFNEVIGKFWVVILDCRYT